MGLERALSGMLIRAKLCTEACADAGHSAGSGRVGSINGNNSNARSTVPGSLRGTLYCFGVSKPDSRAITFVKVVNGVSNVPRSFLCSL